MDAAVLQSLRRGVVIPAHPLALDASRKLDERRQRALTRYYCDAGAGGLAVGVHTTQFAIRDPKIGLFEPVLRLVAETARQCEAASGRRLVKVAGVCGKTPQAVKEARTAREIGYDVGLLSLAALPDATDAELLDHCRAVDMVMRGARPAFSAASRSRCSARCRSICGGSSSVSVVMAGAL